jgi:signal transduction histidine kinase
MRGSIVIRVKMLENNMLETEVEDSGIGIKDEEKQRLFSFFGKLQSSYKMN